MCGATAPTREFNPAWVLSPDLVADALARLRQLCDAPAVADQRSPIVAELADVEAQLERLTDTIALAGNVASVVQRLRRLEHRRQALAETLEACPASPPPLPRIDWRLVERQAHQLLGQWRELLLEDVGDARRVLRELLGAASGSRRCSTRRAAAIASRARSRSAESWREPPCPKLGVPGQNRTAGLALRRRSLYPTELRGQRVTNFLVYQLLVRLSCSFVARRRLLYLALACNRIATGGIKSAHGVL